jgi:hypothetical protein
MDILQSLPGWRRSHMQFGWLNRREFITLLGGVATWPIAARAQQKAKIARIGILGLLPVSGFASRFEAFRAGLRDLGYVEGDSLFIEYRWAERPTGYENDSDCIRFPRRSGRAWTRGKFGTAWRQHYWSVHDAELRKVPG